MNELTSLLQEYHLLGLTICLLTFMVIGICHPLVIKGEYYFGTRCWWAFLVTGLVSLAAALAVTDVLWSSLLGVWAFSMFWSIKELFEQRDRVNRGWFPANPKRKNKK